MSTNTKFYAVARGRKPGVYDNWEDCEEQVHKFKGTKYKSFDDYGQAEEYLFRFGISVDPDGAKSSPDLEAQSQSSTSTSLSALPLAGPSVTEARGRKRARTDRSPAPEESKEKLEEVSIAQIVDMLGGLWHDKDKVMIPEQVMDKLYRLAHNRRCGF